MQHPLHAAAESAQESLQLAGVFPKKSFLHNQKVAGVIEVIRNLEDGDICQAASPCKRQTCIGGGGGINLTLQKGGEIQQPGHNDFHIVPAQADLLQKYLQVLQGAARQAVDTNAFALQVGRVCDATVFARYHVEYVLWVNVVNRP